MTILETLSRVVTSITSWADIRFVKKTDYIVDTALNATSTNPLQNKVVNTEINNIKSQINNIDISAHNTNTSAHNDMRQELKSLADKINAFLDSDDATLDELSELIVAIKNNKTTIEQLTSGKVNVTDIVNNLTTNVSNKPLSAAQGVELKSLINNISVPTKLSQLSNDAGYISSYTETDPTVPSWAKESSKPSYSKSEVGLGNVDNVKQYSANNPPPYPVTSVNGKTGAVTVDILPAVTTADNGKVLVVVNGAWKAVDLNMSVDSNGVLFV